MSNQKTGSPLRVWKRAPRERDDQGRHGSLHVKCAVIDECALLVSSANLTDYAFNLNMELGLVLRGGDAASLVYRHVRELMQHGVLVSATPAR